MPQLKTFPGLTASDFMHPWDVKATAALKAVPGFDKLIAKVMEYSFERVYYLQNVADNVRVSDKMFPKLNRYLEWGCKILDVPKPELYVSLDPAYNAFTYGHTKPFIVVTSSLLNLLDEHEKMFVICHELGHIKCEHVLYTLVAENLAVLIEILGKMTLLDRAYKLLITIFRTHPFPIMRAKHLDLWIGDGGFAKVSGLSNPQRR